MGTGLLEGLGAHYGNFPNVEGRVDINGEAMLAHMDDVVWTPRRDEVFGIEQSACLTPEAFVRKWRDIALFHGDEFGNDMQLAMHEWMRMNERHSNAINYLQGHIEIDLKPFLDKYGDVRSSVSAVSRAIAQGRLSIRSTAAQAMVCEFGKVLKPEQRDVISRLDNPHDRETYLTQLVQGSIFLDISNGIIRLDGYQVLIPRKGGVLVQGVNKFRLGEIFDFNPESAITGTNLVDWLFKYKSFLRSSSLSQYDTSRHVEQIGMHRDMMMLPIIQALDYDNGAVSLAEIENGRAFDAGTSGRGRVDKIAHLIYPEHHHLVNARGLYVGVMECSPYVLQEAGVGARLDRGIYLAEKIKDKWQMRQVPGCHVNSILLARGLPTRLEVVMALDQTSFSAEATHRRFYVGTRVYGVPDFIDRAYLKD